MKKLLLLCLCFAACRSESEHDHSTDRSVPDRPSRPQQARSSTKSKPSPLLKTERITVSYTGSPQVFSKISSIEQAEAILEDLRGIPPSTGRDKAICSVIDKLAKIDPAQARLLLETWDDALIDQWLDSAIGIAQILADSDPDGAADFIENSVPRAAQPGVWGQFLVKLAPADRLAYFDRIPDGKVKLSIAGDLVHVWLAEDPAACARWMDEFSTGRSADELGALTSSIRNPFNPSANTSQRLTALNSATNPEVRRLLANELWLKADKTERAGLLSDLEPILPDLAEHERKSMISQAPAEYAASLSRSEIAELPAKTMQSLIRSWSDKHPEAAFEWAEKNRRPEAARALTFLYFHEPEKALAAAATFTPGKDLDRALSSLCAMAAFDGRVEAARKLIPLIQDPGLRKATISNVEKNADKPRR